MSNDSICEFIPDKNYRGNLKIVNFVYEADFKNLPQPFFKPFNIIYLVTKGEGILKSDGGQFAISEGCVFFTFSGCFFEIEADEDLEYIKNTIPQFILDFQKRLYSRGGDSIGSNKN